MDNWNPKETTQLFKHIEEIGLASCIRAMAYILDAGVEHLKQEADKASRPTIEGETDERDMVKFSIVAKRIKCTPKTLHRWWEKGIITGCRKTGPRTYKMPLEEAERLEREYRSDNGLDR